MKTVNKANEMFKSLSPVLPHMNRGQEIALIYAMREMYHEGAMAVVNDPENGPMKPEDDPLFKLRTNNHQHS